MSTNHHTPHNTGDALNASVLNAVYSDLDAAITANAGASGTVVPGTVQGRLSLSSTEPTPTGDISGATTLYFLPYNGELVALYDGTSDWEYHSIPSAGVSASIPATTDTNYDVYLYDASGTLALELVAWTNATTRATALTTQDGVKVKTGDTTRLYLGIMRTTGISGECNDTSAVRYLANYYNRVPKTVLKQLAGNHTYATATFRAWNGDSGSSIDALFHADMHVRIEVNMYITTQLAVAGIGIDSTTVTSANIVIPAGGASADLFAKSIYQGVPSEGYHKIYILQKGSGGTATSWFGSSAAGTQSGLVGEIYV